MPYSLPIGVPFSMEKFAEQRRLMRLSQQQKELSQYVVKHPMPSIKDVNTPEKLDSYWMS